MVNLKCKKLYAKGKYDLRCIEKGKDLANCNKDCKDMIMSRAWKDLLYEENNTEDLDPEEFTLWWAGTIYLKYQ